MSCLVAKFFRTLPAIVLILLFVGGCRRVSQGNSETIRVGVITSLTGINAAFGQAHKVGYTIALDEINRAGGIGGKKLELVFYDDQSKPDKAVQGVAKLVDANHVPLILGAYASESTRAIIPVITQRQVPLLIPTSTADNVMQTGSQWVFRLCSGSSSYATATVDFLKNNGNPNKLAVVYESTNFGQATAMAMVDAAKKSGLQVVATEAYQASAPDYKALLQHVKQKNPDVIYFAAYLLDATTLMRQSAEVNLNPMYFTAAGGGFIAPEFPTEDKGAGKYAAYTFSVTQWAPVERWKGSMDFDQKYTQIVGLHPAEQGAEAYADLLVAAEALKQAASLEPRAIRDALRRIDLQDTSFGPIKFDGTGQNAHPLLITQVQPVGGNFQYKIVWPDNVAEAKPLTTPPWSQR